jgi:hypothetical protein
MQLVRRRAVRANPYTQRRNPRAGSGARTPAYAAATTMTTVQSSRLIESVEEAIHRAELAFLDGRGAVTGAPTPRNAPPRDGGEKTGFGARPGGAWLRESMLDARLGPPYGSAPRVGMTQKGDMTWAPAVLTKPLHARPRRTVRWEMTGVSSHASGSAPAVPPRLVVTDPGRGFPTSRRRPLGSGQSAAPRRVARRSPDRARP